MTYQTAHFTPCFPSWVSEDLHNHQIRIRKIEKIGEGFWNYAYRVNDALIVRVAKNHTASEKLRKEYSVVKAMKARRESGVRFPNFLFAPIERDATAFLVHEEIRGRMVSGDYHELEEEESNRMLGKMLSFIHSFEKNASLPIEKSEYHYDHAMHLCDYLIKNTRNEAINRYTEEFSEISELFYEKINVKNDTFVHTDIKRDHIFFSEKQEISLIDWGNCCWGDVARDYVHLYEQKGIRWIGRFAAEDKIREDEDFFEKLVYFAFLRNINDLVAAHSGLNPNGWKRALVNVEKGRDRYWESMRLLHA